MSERVDLDELEVSAGRTIPTWCPQCGPEVRVDEDGCCITCGADAMGPGAEQACNAHRRVTDLEGLLGRVAPAWADSLGDTSLMGAVLLDIAAVLDSALPDCLICKKPRPCYHDSPPGATEKAISALPEERRSEAPVCHCGQLVSEHTEMSGHVAVVMGSPESATPTVCPGCREDVVPGQEVIANPDNCEHLWHGRCWRRREDAATDAMEDVHGEDI